MTRTEARDQLTNGDLNGMDAYDLRQHLAGYVAEHGWPRYAVHVAGRISDKTEISEAQIRADIDDDVEAIRAGQE